MAKQLLVVVDMINDFVTEGGALFFEESRRIIKPVLNLIEETTKDDGIVMHITDWHAEDDKEFERFPKHAIMHTEGAEIIPELPRPANYLNLKKRRYSGFFDTNLDAFVSAYIEYANNNVTVVGVCTSICVMDTVAGFANRDWNITVPRDCVADFDPEMERFALKRMETLYGAKII